jgi:hypothetical protein
MSLFKNAGNYFLSIFFDWKDIYKLLDIPEAEQSDFVITDNYHYRSLNANDGDGLGIDSNSAVFEYYIIPNSLRNGGYSYSTIFDQQLKRFFESPNINYGPVLKNSKKDDSSIVCLFNKNIANGKAGFAIHVSREENRKTVIFLFDEKYLNDAHTKWGDKVPFEAYEISFDHKNENVVKEISVSPDVVHISVLVQSQDDAQSSPFSGDLHKYFKNKNK